MLAIYTILPILKRCLLDGEELCVWGLDTKSQSFSYSDCHLIGELCQEMDTSCCFYQQFESKSHRLNIKCKKLNSKIVKISQ